MTEEKIKFMEELMELCKKHNVAIQLYDSCGDPFLINIENDDKFQIILIPVPQVPLKNIDIEALDDPELISKVHEKLEKL